MVLVFNVVVGGVAYVLQTQPPYRGRVRYTDHEWEFFGGKPRHLPASGVYVTRRHHLGPWSLT